MPLDTLRTIAMEKSKKQPKQIDNLTEEAPILDQIPFAASTHDMWHVAEELASTDSMGFVAMDAPLPSVDSSAKLIRFDLAKMGGQIEVGEDKARQYGGKEKYFADKTGPVLKMTGQKTEQVMVYDNLRQYAIDRKKAGKGSRVYDAGGTGAANYSIIAVRFEEGVCSGLYNPNGFGNGVLFDVQAINGGNLYKDDKGVLVYGVRLKCDLGMMLTGDRNIATIVNIDLAAGKTPTEAMIDDLLADVRATNSGRTVLLMHQRVQSWLGRAFKGNRLDLRPADDNITKRVKAWEGVPILNSYNLLDGTETRVVLS